VPALSAVVYRAEAHVPRSKRAPDISLRLPAGPHRDRVEVGAEVSGDSFYEVTFLARKGHGRWRSIGTDDNAPYRVFHDIADRRPGSRIEYRAVVLDNAGHTRTSGDRSLTVAQPSLTITSPREGANVRGFADITAEAVPEHSTDVVVFDRRIGAGPWTRVGTDSSSPVYSLHDTFSLDLATGTVITYRATLNGVVTATRSVRVQKEQIATAVVHYRRGEDRAGWGLHLWGEALAPGVATDWSAPRMPTRVENGEAIFEIPLAHDTEKVNFIIHAPGADAREPSTNADGSRSFIPLDRREVWVRQGDPATYFAPPP
jgi:alpha-amylase